MYYHSKHVEQKIKRVTSVGLSLFNYQDDARSNEHKIALLCYFISVLNNGRRTPSVSYFPSTRHTLKHTPVTLWHSHCYFRADVLSYCDALINIRHQASIPYKIFLANLYLDFEYCHFNWNKRRTRHDDSLNAQETYSSESVIAVQIVFLWQSLGDHADVMQGLAFYAVLTGCLCVFSWLGNDLTTEVSENIHLNYSSSVNGFHFDIKERLALASQSTPQCLLHKNMYIIFLSGISPT